MKMNRYNRYRIGSYFLVGLALLLLLATSLTDPQNYMESPLLVLSATCFIGGVSFFALGGEPSINARLTAQLSMQGIPTLDRIIREQGCYGAATILPSESKDGRIMQFIPIRPNSRLLAENEDGFTHHNGSMGTLGPPLAGPLLDDLKQENDLTLPGEDVQLIEAVREVCEDLLSVVDRVDARREGNSMIFNLHNYLLLPACITLREERTRCVLCPCSICSLIACMIAEGWSCEVNLHRVTLESSGRSSCMRIHYVLTFE